MQPLVLRQVEAGQDGTCALCRKPVEAKAGPQLLLSGTLEVVCRVCGHEKAPALAALLQLAQVAQRVGQISHHARQWVPMEALLDLARASEDYFSSALPEKKPA